MLKTLREDGFKVTCFERRKQVGGLWAYTKEPSMTTALPCRFYITETGCKALLNKGSYESFDQ